MQFRHALHGAILRVLIFMISVSAPDKDIPFESEFINLEVIPLFPLALPLRNSAFIDISSFEMQSLVESVFFIHAALFS